jgi:NADH:ubiquinone oxidoreductase subunit C
MSQASSLSREEALIGQLKAQFPEAIKDAKIDRARRITVNFEKDRVLDISRFMCDILGFDHVKGVAGVDFPTQKKIEVLYFVGTYSKAEVQDLIVVLKAELPRDNPVIASVVSVWQSAHYHERETFEMFGVKFEGHPDLRKLLTQDNWEGPPPMLKDVKFPEMGQR